MPANQDETARYLAYVKQFQAVMAARSGAAAPAVKEEEPQGAEAVPLSEVGAAGGGKRERDADDVKDDDVPSKRAKAEAGAATAQWLLPSLCAHAIARAARDRGPSGSCARAGDDDVQWEEADGVAAEPDAVDGKEGQGDEDLEWEDA